MRFSNCFVQMHYNGERGGERERRGREGGEGERVRREGDREKEKQRERDRKMKGERQEEKRGEKIYNLHQVSDNYMYMYF